MASHASAPDAERMVVEYTALVHRERRGYLRPVSTEQACELGPLGCEPESCDESVPCSRCGRFACDFHADYYTEDGKPAPNEPNVGDWYWECDECTPPDGGTTT